MYVSPNELCLSSYPSYPFSISYFVTRWGAKHCNQHVCMSVCLRISKHHMTKLHKIICMSPVAVVWSCSDYNAIHNVLLVLWTISSLYIMGKRLIQAVGKLHTVTRQLVPGQSQLSSIALFWIGVSLYPLRTGYNTIIPYLPHTHITDEMEFFCDK